MKLTRLLALLLCAMFLCQVPALAEGELRSWNKKEGYVYVNLGQYPQTKEGGVLPILWRVLTVEEDRAYLCSEYVLFAMPMHRNMTEYKKIGKDFGQTELSAYLNGQFSQDAFPAGELELLLPFETYGKVFLLDSEDLKNPDIGMGPKNGSAKSNPRKAWGTEYALENGLYRFQRKYGGSSPYWTRNQSTSDIRHGRCTKDSGQLGHIASDRENEGVRPAIYLDMAKVEIIAGAGTMEDPFQLRLPDMLPAEAE